MLVAGIDQGTTSTKGLLLGPDGIAGALPALPHRQSFPVPGRVEQDADELLANVQALAVAAIHAGAHSLGLANQGETVIAWNRDTGEPLAPAITWQDERTAAAVARLVHDGAGDEVAERSGLPLDCYFAASKLRWLLDNAPGAGELAARGRLGLGTSDSYCIERLTGRYATDPTTASRTSLMNLASCTWDAGLGEIFGVPIDLLPAIADDREPIGEVRTEAGLATLHAAAVDQIAALYGHGCRATGSGKVTVGTGAFALIVASAGSPQAMPPGSIPTVAWPGRNSRTYAADGGVYSASAAVDWLVRLGILRDHAELAELGGDSAASRGAFFVPAFAGLAFPYWDRSATGLLIGIDGGTTREVAIKAVLEGVAFRVADVLDGLGFSRQTPVPVDGGLARSAYFTRFLAGIGERPLLLREGTEVTALGIAQLAAAVARNQNPASLPASNFVGETTVEPNMIPDLAAELRQRFAEAVSRSRGWRQ